MSVRLAVPAVAVLLAVAVTAHIAARCYDRLPRLEDELAYLYQARVFAAGRLFAASPTEPLAFGVPFVVDFEGRRFSKYPPGGSLALAAGIGLGDPWLVGPLLGALALAVTYRLGRDLFDEPTALLSTALGLTSPFFLVMTPSLMAHPSSMLAMGLFTLLFLRLSRRRIPQRLTALSLGAGLALGFGFLVRPYTVAWFVVPFAGIALAEFLRDPRGAVARYGPLAFTFATAAMLLPLYNHGLTGQLRLSLYDLWWPFDRLGFGPGVGPRGFTPADALRKTGWDLEALAHDLHGVPYLSLIPLAMGLLLPPRSRSTTLFGLTLGALVVGAFFYHSGSRLYGPRYYYEALPLMLLLSACGIQKAMRWSRRSLMRRAAVYPALALFIGVNLALYLPFRFSLLEQVYDGALHRQATEAVRRAGLHQALVFVFADDWPDAAAAIMATDPFLRGDVIYARYLGPESYRAAAGAHRDRTAYFWREGTLSRAADPPPQWYPSYPTVRYPNP